MRAIETITGPVTVLMRDDVDTDQIMPKQFLKRVERTDRRELRRHLPLQLHQDRAAAGGAAG
jgi:3-isopropylmalate dehydratase small subunit